MELVPDLWKPLAEQFASRSSLAEIDEMIYGTTPRSVPDRSHRDSTVSSG